MFVKKIFLTALAVGLFAASGLVQAAATPDYFLGTNITADYANPANWSAGVPSAGYTGIIASGNTATLSTDVSAIVSDQSLQIGRSRSH